MKLPSYYTGEGLPNPEYMNALYVLLGMPDRVHRGDGLVAEDMNCIYRFIGMPELATNGNDWASDRLIIEGVLRERGLIESGETNHG